MEEYLELNKKLAKFAELENFKVENGIITFSGIINEEKWSNLFIEYFTNSLDSCIAHFGPKLIEKRISWELKQRAGYQVMCTLQIPAKSKWALSPSFRCSVADIPSLAFCLAVEKLIDKEAN